MDYDTRKAALDALTYGLRALKAQITEARSSLALTTVAVRRLKARADRWRAAHSALSCDQGAERTRRMNEREADVCGRRCDHGSECLLLAGHVPRDRHETQHGCIVYDPRPPMPSRESTAVDLLRCAMSHEPGVRLIGNVRACEVAALCTSLVTSCPKCGADPWVNIDCDMCHACGSLAEGVAP